jgi:hypothetical protein
VFYKRLKRYGILQKKGCFKLAKILNFNEILYRGNIRNVLVPTLIQGFVRYNTLSYPLLF